jgi:hypothetical protein
MILYFDRMGEFADKVCKSDKPWAFDSQNIDHRACACQTLFTKNLLVRLSGAQLMSPRDVAWALVVPNILYTVFGLFFSCRTYSHASEQIMHLRDFRDRHPANFGPGANPDPHGHAWPPPIAGTLQALTHSVGGAHPPA